MPHIEARPVCPELEIGLGVPRAPIRIEQGPEGRRLVQPKTGLDVTDRMQRFAEGFLAGLGEVDGFLLKNRSPSCGVSDVKIYGPGGVQPATTRGAGLFAAAVLERYPLAAVEDEGRLHNFRLREHWLTRIWALAELRGVKTMGGLVRFHARHKLLLMAYRETALRSLGRLVANAERRRFPALKELYRAKFFEALARPPEPGPLSNVLEHAMGFFKEELAAGEKRHFLSCLRKLRAGRLPLGVPVAVLRGWLARHPQPWLEGQSVLDPYPEELVDLGDSGKGRDLG
jgi:uncharacterized protein YbgA (DUF1722 family)/uncharacterized protein YbbK (DUF523 family)